MLPLYRSELAIILLAIWTAAMSGICAGSQPVPKREAPSQKEIISLVLSLASMRLDQASFCNNAGTSPADSTIGQFLAGFWEAHADTTGNNFIRTSVRAIPGASAAAVLSAMEFPNCEKYTDTLRWCNEDVWLVNFDICRRDNNNNERWCWGVRFLMKQANRRIIAGTLRCAGAG